MGGDYATNGSALHAPGSYAIGAGSLFSGFRVASSPVAVGDFDENGVVDAADYVVWRKNAGTQADYNLWRSHFGQIVGSGLGASANAAVPEPATAVLLIFAIVGWGIRRGPTG